jgi:hypothetical protein
MYTHTHTVGEDRDVEAKRDLKVLERVLAAKKRVSSAKKNTGLTSKYKEDAITKELHVLEKKHRQEQDQENKILQKEKKDREDRDVLAEHYCETHLDG